MVEASRPSRWSADESRVRAWRRWSDWPLTALAGLFLVLYAVQVPYRFVLRNPLDLLAMALPVLRPLRVVTVVTLLNRRFIHALEQRVALFACGATYLDWSLAPRSPCLTPSGCAGRHDHNISRGRLVGADDDHHGQVRRLPPRGGWSSPRLLRDEIRALAERHD